MKSHILFCLLIILTSYFRNGYGKSSTVVLTTAIENEWSAQRGNKIATEAITDELHRIERLLVRLKLILPQEIFSRFSSVSKQLTDKFYTATPSEMEVLYVEIRQFKRALMFSDPRLDFNDIVCIDNPYAIGPEPTHEVRTRTENAAAYGGKLMVIKDIKNEVTTSQLSPTSQTQASYWRPDLSFDGTKVLYSMREADKNSYNLYEIGIDGKNHRQITHSDYNDFDPIYSPDGGIIFTTSRTNQFLRCGGGGYRMSNLARCDINGKNIYFISSNIDADFTPTFLPDGRILYTRWEYIDKSVFRVQSLWTVYPDGTNPQTYWGNQSRWPDMLVNARPIPSTHNVVFSAAGHHDIYGGGLGIVNPNEGTNYPDGLYNLTNHIPWAEVGNGPADSYWNETLSVPTCYKAFQTPYPVTQNLMLVSARKGTHFATVHDKQLPFFDLYLMDLDGNMELIHKGNFNIFYGLPVRPREKPALIPSSVVWPGKMRKPNQEAEWGTLYSSDVYEESGIPRGMAKWLRVLEVEPQTYSDGCKTQDEEKAPFIEAGAIPYYHGYGETVVSLLMDDATKRIWGVVPVEDDGSVNFKVPPVKGLYFQLLDEKGRALQTMRSSTHVMPGEVRGCYGCHETKQRTPSGIRTKALKRKPSQIIPPSWGDSTINFPSFVQPILDRNCIKCHNSEAPKGNFDLTAKRAPNTPITWSYVKLVFGDNPKSVEQWAQKTIAGPIIPYHTYANNNVKYSTEESVIPPMTALSYRSRLIEIATSGAHHGVRVTAEEEAKLVAWIDALCPFMGLEDIVAQPDMDAKLYEVQTDYNKGLSFPGLMRTAPYVHKAFMQDDFNTQEDRIPKNKKGDGQPAFIMKGTKRVYQIPTVLKP